MANNSIKHKYFTVGVFAYLLAIVGGLFVVEARTELPIFELRYNPFALISLTGVIAAIIILTLLIRHRADSQENMWMLMAVFALLLYSGGEMMQRLSVNPASAIFWSQVTGMGAYFVSGGIFLFVLYFTQSSLPRNIVAVCVLVSAMVLNFFDAGTSIIFRVEPRYTSLFPWGYNNVIGPGFFLHALWTLGLTVSALFLLLRFRSHTGSRVLKKQATIFFFALLGPIIGATVFDSLLPALHMVFLPPLAVSFAITTVIVMTVGVLRYRIFELSPALLSQNILSTMNEAVIVTNADFEIEFTNEEVSNLLLVAKEKLVKQPISKYLGNDDRITKALRVLRNSPGSQIVLPPIDDLTIRRNETLRHIRVLTSPIIEGKQTEGYIFVIADVTELKQAYADLEEAKAGVEHTVEVRTRELRSAQKKLLEMDKLKTEFIMLTSHNLRTPLAVINGYTSALKTTPLDDSQRHIINNLDISSQRLGKLINNLLTISVIESKEEQLTRRPIKASELLWQVVGEADTTAKGNGNDDKFTRHISVGDALIVASPERLKAAIGNILENAFKFTKQGEVTFDATAKGNKLVIKTKDTGIGIKPDEIPKLFTKFHRGTDTLEFGYEGEGIGLYLTKLVIDEHEGTIKINSEEGKGTLVTITLPITKPDEMIKPKREHTDKTEST